MSQINRKNLETFCISRIAKSSVFPLRSGVASRRQYFILMVLHWVGASGRWRYTTKRFSTANNFYFITKEITRTSTTYFFLSCLACFTLYLTCKSKQVAAAHDDHQTCEEQWRDKVAQDIVVER
ncbi:hypothetical protein HS088_TW08G00622 [Tripterygium wilfordii]|uniref:Uncharacterized protein n=1 Tax=Tripterygium wilfordii TaxID=458696 RepID=A0A7J7DCI5_TRIWF|nr:hypothetical protein HS088_TW08G00622 [Tripterygium wilfordii]